MEPEYIEDEIDLYKIWQVITKHKKFIVFFTVIMVMLVSIATIFMTNYYQSKTVILPTLNNHNNALSSLTGINTLASLAGISLSNNTESEIMALLNSNILKVEVINKYNLLPILFYNSWDSKHKRWKIKNFYLKKIIYNIKWAILSLVKSRLYKPNLQYYPTIDDGIKKLNKLMSINEDNKLNTISISIDFPNPYIAKNICEDILITLRQHLSNEAIKLAEKNRILLEQELKKTSDPIIQQKIYELIAKQIETIITAKINETFAFKVIDPPRISTKIDKPNRLLIIIITFVISIFFSIMLVFLKEYIYTIKNIEYNN